MKIEGIETVRTTVSINSALYEYALDIVKLRKFDSFSSLIASLIRDEHERRFGSQQVPPNNPNLDHVKAAIQTHEDMPTPAAPARRRPPGH